MDDEHDIIDPATFDPDFDLSPKTGTIIVIPEAAESVDDWEQNFKLDRPGLADDPLVATFTDMDLEPAREGLKLELADDDYWSE